tara:strand:+ start:496 stop:1305 length:810 start_codon:yes stop_codon:yes gene_type:complete
MGFIRGSLLFTAGILLFVSFLAGNVFLTLTLSMNPENVQEQVVSNFDEIISSVESEGDINLTKEMKDKFPLIESYCENNTEFVYSQEGYTIDIPCSTVAKGEEAVFEEGVGDIIEEVYTQEYTCDSFWKCVLNSENPLFLFSEQTKDYLKSKFYLSLFISLFLITIMFFLVEQKTNFFLATGSLLIISSLPFMKINTLLSFFDYSFLQFLPVLFSEAYFVFLISFIAGIIILTLGLALKFFHFGNFITEKLDNLASKKKSSKKEVFKKK